MFVSLPEGTVGTNPIGIGPGGGPWGVVGSSAGCLGGGIGEPGSEQLVESRLLIRCTPIHIIIFEIEIKH